MVFLQEHPLLELLDPRNPFDSGGKRQALTSTAPDPERHVARQRVAQLPQRPVALPRRSASARAHSHRACAGCPGGRDHLARGQIRPQIDRVCAEIDGDHRARESAELMALARERCEEDGSGGSGTRAAA